MQIFEFISCINVWYSDLVSKYNFTLGRLLTDVIHTYRYTIINHLIVNGFFRLSRLRQRAHVSADDAFSSMAPDPSSIFFKRSEFAPLLFCIFPLDFWFWTLFVITTCHDKLYCTNVDTKRDYNLELTI